MHATTHGRALPPQFLYPDMVNRNAGTNRKGQPAKIDDGTSSLRKADQKERQNRKPDHDIERLALIKAQDAGQQFLHILGI